VSGSEVRAHNRVPECADVSNTRLVTQRASSSITMDLRTRPENSTAGYTSPKGAYSRLCHSVGIFRSCETSILWAVGHEDELSEAWGAVPPGKDRLICSALASSRTRQTSSARECRAIDGTRACINVSSARDIGADQVSAVALVTMRFRPPWPGVLTTMVRP
jgi:hypothetical protein